jgi:hypothetical protein
MPAINQPKLGELYNTTFYIPSSMVSSIIVPASNVPYTDGQGGQYYVPVITMPVMFSTVDGLGSAGYISSPQLLSTVENLASAGYVSTLSLESTIAGLGGTYVSSLSLISTVEQLGSLGYLSSQQLVSSIDYVLQNYVSTGQLFSSVNGLGSAGYVSTVQLLQTSNYFQQYFVSTGQLASTVNGLGSAGYVSSTQLISSISNLLTGIAFASQLTSTLNTSTLFAQTLSASSLTAKSINADSISAATVVVYGSNTLYVYGNSILASTFVHGSLTVSTLYGSTGFVNVDTVSTNNVFTSTISFRDTISGDVNALYSEGGVLTFDGDAIITQGSIDLGLISTTIGLGQAGYVSTLSLNSTVQGIDAAYISNQELTSTLNNFNVSTLRVGNFYAESTFTNYLSAPLIVGRDVRLVQTYSDATQNIAYGPNVSTLVNAQTNGFLTQGNGVCAGSGRFIAVGDSLTEDGSIKVSLNNGVTWTNASVGGFTNASGQHIGYSVAFNGSKYVAGGDGIDAKSSIMTSTDGFSWKSASIATQMPVYEVIWANNLGGTGRWLSAGNGQGRPTSSIQISTDGESWSAITSGGFDAGTVDISLKSVGYCLGYDSNMNRLWAGGYGSSNRQMLTSLNGTTWTQRTMDSGPFFNGDAVYGIAYNGSRWAVTGQSWNVVNQTLMYSSNSTGLGGSSWGFSGTGFEGDTGLSVFWDSNQGKFYATGSGTSSGGAILQSSDASNWSSVPNPPSEYFGSYVVNHLAFGNNTYIAVGNGNTQVGGNPQATLIGPSSISTGVVYAGAVIAADVTVTGGTTLHVMGLSKLNTVTMSTLTASTMTLPSILQASTIVTSTLSVINRVMASTIFTSTISTGTLFAGHVYAQDVTVQGSNTLRVLGNAIMNTISATTIAIGTTRLPTILYGSSIIAVESTTVYFQDTPFTGIPSVTVTPIINPSQPLFLTLQSITSNQFNVYVYNQGGSPMCNILFTWIAMGM